MADGGNTLVDVVIQMLGNNINTVGAEATTLNLLTKENYALTCKWTSQMDTTVEKNFSKHDSTSEGVTSWISGNLNSKNIDNFSTLFIQHVMSELGQHFGDNGAAELSIVQSYASALQSKSESEEGLGKNTAQSEASLASQANNLLNPIEDMASTVLGIGSTLAGLIASVA